MKSLDYQNKTADYLINRPFCSDDFIRSYKIVRKAGDRSKCVTFRTDPLDNIAFKY